MEEEIQEDLHECDSRGVYKDSIRYSNLKGGKYADVKFYFCSICGELEDISQY